MKYYTEFGEEVKIPKINNLNIIDAIILLEKHQLCYEIDSFKYDLAYKKLQVLYVFPEEGAIVKKGRNLFIRCNPNYIPLILIPDVTNKNKYLGMCQINTLGFKINNITYKYNINYDKIIQILYKGKVVKAGEFIPKYSKIDLVIGLK